MIDPRLMGNRELLKEIKDVKSAISEDYLDERVIKWEEDRLAELEKEAKKRGLSNEK